MSFKSLKTTVLKKLDRDKLFEGVSLVDPEEKPVCPSFEEEQVFEVGADGKMPNGFCIWNWNNIYLQAIPLMLGGELPWLKEKREAIACCTDDLRPVIFHFQRVV